MAHFRTRLLLGLLATFLLAPVAVILQGTLKVWGVLDPVTNALGALLKQNFSPDKAAWTVAAILALAMYSFALWLIWIRTRVHGPNSRQPIPFWVWGWHFRQTPSGVKFNMETRSPVVLLVPMRKAAIEGYDNAVGTAFGNLIEGQFPAARHGNLKWHANSIADDAVLYGFRPSSQVIRRIPEDDAKSFAFSDDGNVLSNQFDPEDRYLNVAVRRRDLREWIKTVRWKKAANALGTPPRSTPAPEPESLLPPPRPLTPYEIEQKLPVIDKALSILASMEPTIKDGPRLCAGWWDAITDPTNNASYGKELRAYRDDIKTRAEKLDELRGSIPQYQDIMIASQQTAYNSVFLRVDKFVNGYTALEKTPNADIRFLMRPYVDDFQAALNEFTHWRNTARSNLVEMRRDMSQ